MKIIKIIRNSLCKSMHLKRRKSFEQYFKEYMESYTKRDKRVIKQAYTKYLMFLDTLPEDRRPRYPTHDTVRSFIDFLTSTSRGSGAGSTYSRFKKVMIAAVREGIIKDNPCSEIRGPRSSNELVKDILSDIEIRLLLNTCHEDGNTEIRLAFIFCLYTGLRFSDVASITYSNIDRCNMLLSFRQSKTHNQAHIPLKSDIMELVFRNKKNGLPHQKVFQLPSHPTCMKELRKWTEAVGICKHITWHCARHSFASNILMNGADVRVVASLLGHNSQRYVERYTRAVDQKKYQAIETLPSAE